MSETAVERRLGELHRSDGWLTRDYEAIELGCAAIALLRDWDENETPQDGPSREWKARVAALLARCEGEK
jgi:hypothetical protein